MTREQYESYRLSITARTNAANIHDVYGRLGLILNLISLRDRGHKDYQDIEERISQCQQEIEIKLAKQ